MPLASSSLGLENDFNNYNYLYQLSLYNCTACINFEVMLTYFSETSFGGGTVGGPIEF